MYDIFADNLRIFYFSILLAAALFLTACTTTQPVQDCSPREKSRLTVLAAPTAARLERNRREIARLRTEAGLRRCAAFASPGCTRIAMTTARLDRENAILEGRLRELIAVVNGRPSPALYVRACTASWQPVVKSHPVFRRKAMPRRKFLKAKKPISEQKAKIITPNPPKPAAITLTPLLPVQPAASTPSVQPVTVKATPPPERTYDANLHIRVVGPLFYPALPAAGDRPVPVHAPAP